MLAFLKGGPYAEYFSRSADRIRPPSLNASVLPPIVRPAIHNQYRRPDQTVLDDFETNPPFTLSSSGGAVAGFNLSIPAAPPPPPTDVPLVTTYSGQAGSKPVAIKGYYQATKAVELAWPGTVGGKAYYVQNTVPAISDAFSKRWFSFRTGPHFEQTTPQEMTWELRSGDRFTFVNSSALSRIGVPYKAEINERQNLARFNITKCMFKTFRFNLAAIQADGRDLDLRAVSSARWVFDLTSNGRVVIDDIEYSN